MFKATIADSKDEAEKDLAKYHNEFCVYTDGSGYQGNIGAAAFSTGKDNQPRERQFHLGSDTHHTVFEGEVVGVILALDIILAEPRLRSATILLDNQAAIIALQRRRPQPGQYLIHLFHSQLQRLLKRRRTFQLQLVWVPGHMGIEGNEMADSLAKDASTGTTTLLHCPIRQLSALPHSQAAARATFKKEVGSRWTTQWNASKHGKRITKFDPTPPGKRVTRMYRGLSRPHGSILTQLRSGHVGLNKYLARIKAVDSPLCTHCQTTETVEHFLLGCRRFTNERHDLRKNVGRQHRGPLDRRTLLATPKHLPALFRYIEDTGRFQAYTAE